MFIHNIDPVLLHLGPLEIRYYGLVYAIGFLLAYYVIAKLAEERGIKGLDKQSVGDFIVYLIFGVVIGARFFHVFVYNAPYYFTNPIEIPMVWKGGLSFHGGFVGSVIAGWLFSKKHKVHLLDLADLTVIPLGIALGLGRIANFINGELYGFVTDVPWAVKFPNAEGYRHPSQLYESLKNFFIFGVLWTFRHRKWPKGSFFILFTFMYGVLRFSIEFFRERTEIVGPFSIGQWLSLFMIAFAVTYYFLRLRKSDS